MEILGLIFLIIILVIVFGLLGWVIELIGHIFGFLLEGCLHGIGCFVWIIIIVIFLIGLSAA